VSTYREQSSQARSIGASVVCVEWVALGVVLTIGGVLAFLRYSGQPPFGSDYDEYRLVARTILEQGVPTVDGIEATKYPIGYPIILGVAGKSGFPIVWVGVGFNLLLTAATAVLAWGTARTLGAEFDRSDEFKWLPAAMGIVAALLVVASPWPWRASYGLTPDVILMFITASAFAWFLRLPSVQWRGDCRKLSAKEFEPGPWTVAGLTGIGVVAAVMKTAGLILAGAAALALLGYPQVRRWFWLPVGSAFAVTALQHFWKLEYSEHTTGYLATFWLRDPYDASEGEIVVAELPTRMFDQSWSVLVDLGRASLGPHVDPTLAVIVMLVFLGVLIASVRGRRWIVVAYLIGTVLVLMAWPFRSPRFGLPLIPLVAVGGGMLLGWIWLWMPRTIVGVVTFATVGLLGVHLVGSGRHLVNEARMENARLAPLQTGVAQATEWIAEHVPPNDDIASFSYRELAFRGVRNVLPVGYTSNGDRLWAMTGGRGAEWFVMLRGHSPRREFLGQLLVDHNPGKFELVFENEAVYIYRIEN
jgi:hypothetical protein